MNTAKLRDLVALKMRITELEKELKELREEYDPLNEQMVEQFLDAGTTSISIDGRTAYLYRQLWASAERNEDGDPDWDSACHALHNAGLSDFVGARFNVSTVSAWVREQPLDDDTGKPALPPELAQALRVTEKIEIRVRKGRGSNNG